MSTLDNAYALLIGVGNDLPVTVKDATAIKNILADATLAGYPPENIILLTEKEATRKGILDGFDNLISKINEDSSVLLFYSGHGGLYEPWNQFYLVPNNFDPVEYEDTWVKAEELKEKIQAINSRRLIFFLDCCHAAGMTHAMPTTKAADSEEKLENPDGLAQKIDDGKGMSIISSCREDQLSYIMDGDSNSLFTKCLLEVLKGQHKEHFDEEYVRISEVFQYIFKKVPERNPEQRPYANLQIYDDFVVSNIPKKLRKAVVEKIAEKTKVTGGSKEEVITVFREQEEAEQAIIFVHGFSGEAASTFGNIPNYLINNSELNDWDLFPLGYSQYVKPDLGKGIWASPDDIQKIADYLATSIKYKFGKYKCIAIIAHGLGGLVAQRAILDLNSKNRERISHLLLFATPSKGLKSSALEKLWNRKYRELSAEGDFISKLRKDWDSIFGNSYPFTFRAIAATYDEFVTVESSLQPFDKKYHVTFTANHFSLVKPKSEDDDSYHLILNLLTKTAFEKQHTDDEEVNLLLEEYETVIDKLLPNVNELDRRGLEQLIFALEGMNRSEEAMSILHTNELAKNDSDLLGILGGRYKRKYLKSFIAKDGEEALKYYSQALKMAQDKKDSKQIYYHAINLAFLNLIIKNDQSSMQEFAKLALENCEKDPFNSLWKLATLAEANLYLGNLETSKEFYEKAASMAGQREKISIHTNAYTAYTSLMGTDNPDDQFIMFLKMNFLL